MQQQRILRTFSVMCLAFAALLASSPALAAPPADFRDLIKSAMPAVVNISTERTEEVRQFPRMPFEMFRGHPDMERFFEPFEEFYNSPRSRKMSSLGSGFIISPDGFIVTNNHVVEGADVIRVNISSKSKKEDAYAAEVVGTDPETDLALLKIKANDLPFLKFGDSNALEVGEWVVAIGSPLGLDHTVTAGIVSAKGRNIQSGSYDDFLQTDASINRGNSGGPLLNMAGEVIGINTAIAQRAQGIGFAIPSTLAQRIIGDLQEHKKVSRGWLGVTIQNVDAATAKALDLPEPRGALINSVLDGQPAAEAGIKGGDIILAINDQRIEDTEHLLRAVAQLRPGAKAEVTIWRDGKEEKVTLTVAERDLSQARDGKGGGKSDSATSDMLGLKLRPATSEELRGHNLRAKAGLLILGVENDSLAEKAGLQRGDIVLAANKQAVQSVDELSRVLSVAQKRGVVLLHISHNGQVFYRAIELTKKK